MKHTHTWFYFYKQNLSISKQQCLSLYIESVGKTTPFTNVPSDMGSVHKQEWGRSFRKEIGRLAYERNGGEEEKTCLFHDFGGIHF